jgi:hypothetical protein
MEVVQMGLTARMDYLYAKIERYEEALKYIAGESHIYADTLEEAKESALIVLEEYETEGSN